MPTISSYIMAVSLSVFFQQILDMLGIYLDNSGDLVLAIYNLFTNLDSIDKFSSITGFSLLFLFLFLFFLQRRFFKKNIYFAFIPPILIIFFSLMYPVVNNHYPKYKLKLSSEKIDNFSLLEFTYPPFTLDIFNNLFFNAAQIALVSFLEGAFFSRNLANKNNYPYDSDSEMISLGIANFFSTFFNCYPVFGYFRRSYIYDLFDVSSQLAGLFSGLFVIVLISSGGGCDFIGKIPLVIPASFSCYYNFRRIFFWGRDLKWLLLFRKDAYLYILTFLFCFLFGIYNGLLISIIISFLFVLKRSSKPYWVLRIYMPQFDQDVDMNEEENKDEEEFNVINYETNNNFKESNYNLTDNMSNNQGNIINNNFNQDFNKYKVISTDNRKDLINFLNEELDKFENFEVLRCEICFCLNSLCKRKYHFIIINLYGHLSYVNIGIWIEQTKYLAKIAENRENFNFDDSNLNNNKKKIKMFGIAGIIYEMHDVRFRKILNFYNN